MGLKGQYVKDENDQIGMIESEEHDEEGYISVYYGIVDKREIRMLRRFVTLTPIDTPVNGRVNGENPETLIEEE